MPDYGSFDGKDAKVVDHDSGRSDIYYGGRGAADGDGHGHVVTNDAGSVEYWRDDSGNTLYDSNDGTMDGEKPD